MFMEKNSMEGHKKKSHKCLVRSCKEYFTMEDDRKDHLKGHYQCTHCDKYFQHLKKCLEHISKYHSVVVYSHKSQYFCGINNCKREPSDKKADIEKHIKEKHKIKSKVANDDKTKKCPKCERTFEDNACEFLQFPLL